jgi:S1-C subfamily serine protease
MGPHGTARPARDGTTRADLGSLAQVSDTPEEPTEGDPGPEEGRGGDDAESPLRGWIDPDDRLWRHPSEVPTAASGGPVLLQPPPGKHHRSALMALVGAAAVVAVGVFIAVLLSPSSDHPSTGGTADTIVAAPVSTLPGLQNAVPAAALAAGRSMVELQATTSHGIVALIGIAVAEGGLVVTTADALGGLEHLSVVGPGGTLQDASLLGRDRDSDVALVQVPEDVPVAPFSDDAGLSAAAADNTLTLRPVGTHLVLGAVPGAVVAVGSTITSGPANGMPAITSAVAAVGGAAPGMVPVPGAPLLNSAGQIVGILYSPQPAGATTSTGAPSTVASTATAGGTVTTTATLVTGASYLPTQLVLGVAGDIRAGTSTRHGWLGVSGTDQPGGTGAAVAEVDPASPASGHLARGEVIAEVDGKAVHTMAELRARLYVLTPGTSVALTVQGVPGTTADKVVNVRLGRSS